MNLIRLSIERPSAVIAMVIMVLMFGFVALETIPVQLAPDVNRPLITVTTQWPGAAPAEVEREITIRQEEVLKGIPGLSEISSESEQGRARIRLEFAVGTRMDRALLLVSNRLDRVTSYPDEADEPTLRSAGAEDNAIAWFIITREAGNERPIHEYGDFVDNVVKDRIERVVGVGDVTIYGGSEREIEVVVEPELLARYGLTVSQVLDSLRRANAAISAGDVDEGKRRYVVRTEAELNTLDNIRHVVLRSIRDDDTGRLARVTVADIAEVNFAHKKPTAKIRLLGEDALAFNAKRETGANVIETMDGIAEAVEELNQTQVPGQGLILKQVYDETVYIKSSVNLVKQNIYIGGTLAALVLLLFLRSWRATLIVSLAIPVSVVGSFVAMAALGRSINVISLAGLAFAVGMVVDAAIVVLENIYRLREAGKPARVAAYEGTRQVWGAVLVSALTTVMVFIPILIMELEVGQLFRDIAVAISVSVLLSLLVSVTVLPALANRLLADPDKRNWGRILAKWLKRFGLPVPAGKGKIPLIDLDLSKQRKKSLAKIAHLPLTMIDRFASDFVALVIRYTRYVTRNKRAALAVVLGVTVTTTLGAYIFLPKLEYLPDGNRNLMFGIVLPPPGYNLDTTTEIAKRIENEIRPLWKSESGPDAAWDEPPKIDRFFFVASRASTFLGAAAVDGTRASELKDVLAAPVFKEPGTFAIINQLSIFSRGLGGGRKIELDISGPDLETILQVALRATGRIMQLLPMEQGHQFRPNPGLELGAPEVRVKPDRLRLADNGVTARELGETVDTFNDGLRVIQVTVGNDRTDLML
ncbi:MAG: efflux RND transporter permease subunit, partial [Geminicoccaceae bacterium]